MATEDVPNDIDYNELAYTQITRDYIKVCVFSSFIAVIGIFGNLLSASFYRKQSRTTINVLILSLSIVDFLVSLFSFAFVYHTIVNIKFRSRIACKAFYCVCYWFVGLSELLVAVIAVERYRGITVMQKRGRGASLRVKWVIATCTIFTMALSMKIPFLVDIIPVKYQFDDIFVNNLNTSQNDIEKDLNETNFPVVSVSNSLFSTLSTRSVEFSKEISVSSRMLVTDVSIVTKSEMHTAPENLVITVYKCNFSRTEERKTYVLLNHVLSVLFIVTVILIFLFCYSNVLRTLVLHWKLTRWLHKEQDAARKNVLSTSSAGDETSSEKIPHVGPMSEVHNESVCSVVKSDDIDLETSPGGHSSNRRIKTVKDSKESVAGFVRSSCSGMWICETVISQPTRDTVKTSEVQITLAMVAVSLLLLISFVPYFYAIIYIQYLSSESSVLDWTSIMMFRCSFINSSLNCFVYYIFSSSYRAYVNSLLCLICQRVKRPLKT